MLVLAAESSQALLDGFLQVGRRPDRPVRVEVRARVPRPAALVPHACDRSQVSFTTAIDPYWSTKFSQEGAGATAAAPLDTLLLNATSVSCGLSAVLQANHARDIVLQEEVSLLAEKRAEQKRLTETADFFERTQDSQAAFQPPASPPPPPPAPPPELHSFSPRHPPAPPSTPAIVTVDEEIASMRAKASVLGVEVQALEALVHDCVPSLTVTCGRSAAEAPDPWLAASGVRCRGYSTKETRAGDYCGFWQSTVRAAPRGARKRS